MSELPRGWTRAPLAALCERIVDGSHNPPKATASGYPMLSARNIQNRQISFDDFRLISHADFAREHLRTAVQPSDVLMTIVGTIGRTAVVPADSQPFALQRSVAVLKPVAFEPRSLAYFLESPAIQRHLLDNAKGTAQKGIYLKALGQLELVVPPFSEQGRIADKLDTLLARVDSCRDRLDRVGPMIKRFRQAVLAAATSGKLTADWRSERSAPWRNVKIGEVVESSYYGPRFGKDEYTNEATGIPTIRTTDMTETGRIEISESTPKVNVSPRDIERFRVKRGDLLVTRTGSIGVMAVFDADYLAIPSAYLIRLRFSPEIQTRYAFFCLTAPKGQQALGLSSTATTQPNVNAEAIKRIDIALPETAEQEEIIRRVDQLLAFADRLEARLAQAQITVCRISPALLAKAFRGELVSQDPNDEPAAELLQRLQDGLVQGGKGTRVPRPRRLSAASHERDSEIVAT